MSAALDDTNSKVKGGALLRLASDGGTNANYTNPADVDSAPDKRFYEPLFVAHLLSRASEDPAITAPVLRALTAFRLAPSDIKAIALYAQPAQVIRHSIEGGTYTPDPVSGGTCIAALDLLAAQGEQAQDETKEIAKVLKAEPPGLDELTEPDRKRVIVDWEDYQADVAQTLLATKSNVTEYADRILELWVKTNSRDHIMAPVVPPHTPHLPLIDTCALGALRPDLADRFAQRIERERQDPEGYSTFLLEDALKGLACTGSSDQRHRALAASLFALPRKPVGEDADDWRLTRPESLKSVAAVALIRMGAAGEEGLPSMRDALEGVDKNVEVSWLPGREGLRGMPSESRGKLKRAALEMLDSGEEQARSVAARVLVDLLLAGDSDPGVRAQLLKAASKRGDTQSLRAVLLIAHTNDIAPDYQEKVKNLFLRLLRSGDVPERKNAVRALGGLQLKDGSTHIRRNAVYVPVPLNADYEQAFAPVLAEVYKSVALQDAKAHSTFTEEKKLETLKALGYMRAAAVSHLLDIVASERPRPGGSLQAALEAAPKAGPFDLEGVCRLLESSFEDASPEAARAAAYYVSGGNEVATRLIASLDQGTAAPNPEMPADQALKRLDALDIALEHCKGLPKLKTEAGRLSVGLAKRARDVGDKTLVRRLASKLNDTPYATQISDVAGLNEPETDYWYWPYWVLSLAVLSVLGVFLYKLKRDPLLRPIVYQEADEDTQISIAEQKVSVRWILRHLLGPHKEPVLDAWVQRYADEARKNYSGACDRRDSFDGPLDLNKKRLPSLRPENLHAIFSKNQIRLLVTGAGEEHNSSLACLLGWWSMKESARERPCAGHLMLPVLINNKANLAGGKEAFLKVINERLRVLTDRDDVVPQDFLLQLLMRRRVLVIVVGFSEMSEDQRRIVLDSVMESHVNACVVSSAPDDIWDSLPRHAIRLAQRGQVKGVS